ncbi:hypothetical protein Kpol_1045p11 [Vanderwaltozyma polyspora DSM 70294]|uniref:AAA+ ATPase domain-containing protein n=1 Tax=Vanderwaltozyma polyspora (strain ATCC 22028 / DSM 70294 / BCRC 21397 / CBS 2163 / NBRC 10782 / NRRL Y-8283 / UCD 57-17) TaxID=436907 RepID=A7TI20_VANPO|nr:uncharacterized protein Kpol_1045p11 [Vanderwaltozyma polyspora DSM 70294]EDO18027.1 hypothetical protein Kpol_1045p11 [Vanderwaltozyma polyspora DSM 70294]
MITSRLLYGGGTPWIRQLNNTGCRIHQLPVHSRNCNNYIFGNLFGCIRSYITSNKNILNKPESVIKNYSISISNNDNDNNRKKSDRLLTEREKLANEDLDDPEAQASLYKEMLRFGFPNYVVSRFETQGVSSNLECFRLYIESLMKLGQFEKVRSIKRQKLFIDPYQNFINDSKSSSISNSNSKKSNFGSKKIPIHVIVTESKLVLFVRFLKWSVFIVLILYLLSKLADLIDESSSILPNSEFANKTIHSVKSDVRFEDVCGCNEARAELEEVVDFLKNPSKYESLGGKLPKGILITGPPGTGKTLLARATAGEAGVKFFMMSGSEFDEVYVGVGAKRIRDLFTEAKANAPAIIFIDELDAVGVRRTTLDPAYTKQSLNQLLVELDGFSQTSGIIVIGATNFPEGLDKALTRPGRFDKIVNVSLPDVRGRTEILKRHMRNITLDLDVDPVILARGTPGFSGADLANLVNQAAVYACQNNAKTVNMSHFEWSKDKILLGAEKKSMELTKKTKDVIAYHEAGHAIMALFTPGSVPLYKATILPRGETLGITFQLPEIDKVDVTKKECLARLDVYLGGRIAEELIFGEESATSGCTYDLKEAAKTAKAMVTKYGMSKKVGLLNLEDDIENCSPKFKDLIDNEVVRILKESETRTRTLLASKRQELDRLAHSLLEYETLNANDITKVCKNEELDNLKNY